MVVRSAAFIAALFIFGFAAPGYAQPDPGSAVEVGAEAEVETEAAEPRVAPVLLWWAAQLLPNSDIAVSPDRARYGLRWQFTPLSYSWGINRKLSGWRSLVVEPLTRNSGSIELHVSPGMYFEPRPTELVRTGVRATFPLMHRGEYLSTSVGGFHQWAFGENRGYAEVGLYTLLGIVGLQVAVDPSWQADYPILLSVTARYF